MDPCNLSITFNTLNPKPWLRAPTRGFFMLDLGREAREEQEKLLQETEEAKQKAAASDEGCRAWGLGFRV